MATDLSEPLSQRLECSVKFARAAGELTLRYFRRTDVQVERKSDDSPVTVADRAAEELLRKLIAKRFPEDGILGEELGSTEGSSGFRWVLDPIDGTKSFIHGVPLYTTLVAVLEVDLPRIGVIHAPACGETVCAAVGHGCWYEGDGGRQRARVSRVARLDQGLVLTSDVASFDAERSPEALEAYLRLQSTARLARTWGDGYGYLMVATGRAEVMIDPVMNLWDAAPLQTVIEEAGGWFSDWRGERTVHSGEALATNGLVTDEVLSIVGGK